MAGGSPQHRENGGRDDSMTSGAHSQPLALSYPARAHGELKLTATVVYTLGGYFF